jgi:hypothetical protein
MTNGRSVADLTEDYLEALRRTGDLPKDLAAGLRAYHRFIEREGHHLARYPEQLFALAMAQPQDSPVLAEARKCHARGQGPIPFTVHCFVQWWFTGLFTGVRVPSIGEQPPEP